MRAPGTPTDRSRYAQINLATVRVRRALTQADFAIVAQLREAGFSRLARSSTPAGIAGSERWLDSFDQRCGVFSLIGYDSKNTPIATMRVQDGRVSPLELAKFVPLNTLLSPEQKPPAQFARLSVLKSVEAANVMFGIFKAAWRWCFCEEIPSIVIATPWWARHVYDFMFFEDLGGAGHFSHALARGALHVTMRQSVLNAEDIWRAGKNPLCEQFFEINHPFLDISQGA